MSMVVGILAMGLAAPGAVRPNAAISCRLQIYAQGQKKPDLKGKFHPFLLRFQDNSANTAEGETDNITVFDPENLLLGEAPVQLRFNQGNVQLKTTKDGAAGILYFNAIKPTRKNDNWWFGMVALIGQKEYKAMGPCLRSSGVADLSDETLVIQERSK